MVLKRQVRTHIKCIHIYVPHSVASFDIPIGVLKIVEILHFSHMPFFNFKNHNFVKSNFCVEYHMDPWSSQQVKYA